MVCTDACTDVQALSFFGPGYRPQGLTVRVGIINLKFDNEDCMVTVTGQNYLLQKNAYSQ